MTEQIHTNSVTTYTQHLHQAVSALRDGLLNLAALSLMIHSPQLLYHRLLTGLQRVHVVFKRPHSQLIQQVIYSCCSYICISNSILGNI